MRRGFTLIELLVVMAIIAILVALAIPQYNKYRANAMLSNVQNYTKSLANHITALATTAAQNPNCASATTIYVKWDSSNNKLLACKNSTCGANDICDSLSISKPSWVSGIYTEDSSNHPYITLTVGGNSITMTGYIGVASNYAVGSNKLGCKYDGTTLSDLGTKNSVSYVCHL